MSNTEHVISYDGKKAAAGVKGKRFGDIDLWSVEGSTSNQWNLNELEH